MITFAKFNSDPFDKLERLRAMTSKGQQKWDLSPKDVAAIQMALNVLELLVHADQAHGGDLEIYNVDSVENPKMLSVGIEHEHYGKTAFECFVNGAEALKQARKEFTE